MTHQQLIYLLLLAFTAVSLGSGFVSPAQAPVRRKVSSFSALCMADYSLDPRETAILLIEYQNEFTSPGGKLHDAVKECMEKTNMLENSKNLVTAARAAGCSVVHCPISFEKVSEFLTLTMLHSIMNDIEFF